MSENYTEGVDFADLSKPIEVPIKNLFGKDYVLREAGYGAALSYNNSASRVIQIDPETGKPSAINAVTDDDAQLVASCLFELKPNGGVTQVPYVTVKGWKNSVVQRLAKIAKDISEIGGQDTVESLEKEKLEIDKKIERLRKKEQDLKNESPATAGASDSVES